MLELNPECANLCPQIQWDILKLTTARQATRLSPPDEGFLRVTEWHTVCHLQPEESSSCFAMPAGVRE